MFAFFYDFDKLSQLKVELSKPKKAEQSTVKDSIKAHEIIHFFLNLQRKYVVTNTTQAM